MAIRDLYTDYTRKFSLTDSSVRIGRLAWDVEFEITVLRRHVPKIHYAFAEAIETLEEHTGTLWAWCNRSGCTAFHPLDPAQAMDSLPPKDRLAVASAYHVPPEEAGLDGLEAEFYEALFDVEATVPEASLFEAIAIVSRLRSERLRVAAWKLGGVWASASNICKKYTVRVGVKKHVLAGFSELYVVHRDGTVWDALAGREASLEDIVGLVTPRGLRTPVRRNGRDGWRRGTILDVLFVLFGYKIAPWW